MKLNILIDYRYQQHHKAERGENGMVKTELEKVESKVPMGTQVFEDDKTLIYDFINRVKNL